MHISCIFFLSKMHIFVIFKL